MTEFCLLSSGSKANCLYLRANETRVLVDCGLSARQAVLRLSAHGVDPESIDAIVVTHEHRDHVYGIPTFSKRFNTPVFASPRVGGFMAKKTPLSFDKVNEFAIDMSFKIGGIEFEPCPIPHDAMCTVAFRIRSDDSVIGVATDLGYVTSDLRELFRGLDALVIESNHDELLLSEAPYPWALKERIRGQGGHLSNSEASELVAALSADPATRLQVLVGAHVSENSNTPELALDALENGWSCGNRLFSPEIAVAGVKESSKMFQLAEFDRWIGEKFETDLTSSLDESYKRMNT